MPSLTTQEMKISERPDRLVMVIPSLSGGAARNLANTAVREARRMAPKLSGRMASRLYPVYGKGFFGIAWKECLVLGTRVLTADWRWVPVEQLSAGDALIGFDEEITTLDAKLRGRGRRYRTSYVTDTKIARRECVEIIFDDGYKIQCTKNHPWLVKRLQGHGRRWIEAQNLRVNDKLGVYFEPWEEDLSYEAGWLAGFFDGEGSLGYSPNRFRGDQERSNSASLTAPQVAGAVLEKAIRLLNELGFRTEFSEKRKSDNPNRQDCYVVEVVGGFSEYSRFLGSIRPVRLLPKLRHEGMYMKAIYNRQVVAVRDIGTKRVVLMGTTTKTYMAEGMASHNSYAWYQEHGINPFTMTSLAGKTIPMWIPDPYGTLAEANPRAQTRVTASGVPQVLIFRKAAPIGSYKTVRKKLADGTYEERQVPRSWPGAPGRIGRRESGQPWTTPGKLGGAIGAGNIGVRWRHRGLQPRMFMNHAMTMAAQHSAIVPTRVYIADAGWRARFGVAI